MIYSRYTFLLLITIVSVIMVLFIRCNNLWEIIVNMLYAFHYRNITDIIDYLLITIEYYKYDNTL